ncbi:MAG: hypothetical protein D4R64_00860 [Porphyromonadaceae bacterium]|nr:MAG: hypothetical protein D4R64_00860 [Porphyromonadaceae bacterium]
MKALFLMTITITFLCWEIVVGQEKIPDHGYSRVSLTVIYIDDPSPDPNGGLSSSVRNFVENMKLIGPKFNDHSLPSRFVRIDIPNFTAENRITSASGMDTRAIRDFLAGSDMSRQIVAKWFDRKPDGTLGMDLIGQRGLYNAKDNDYLTATASQRQLGSLKDQGENLLKLSYLLFINFSDIQYKEAKTTPGKGDYGGCGRGYLYKLAWNDSVSAQFYENLWISENDPEAVKAEKKRKFDSTAFPMEFVRDVSYNVAPSLIVLPNDKRTDEEKRTALLNNLYENILLEIENRVPDFQVRQNLISSKPIGATIGLKEGVYVDQRFFVYENVQKKNQDVYKRRRAVVRAKQVADNQKITEGKSKPTTFYQVAGGKIDHFGMFLEQKNDHGISITALVLSGEMGGLNLTLGYNLSRTLSKTMKMKTIPTGVYLFADLAADPGTYSNVDVPGYYSNSFDGLFTRVSVGLSKDFYFMHHFQLSPRIGYGIETTSLYAKGDNASFPDGLSITGDHLLAGGSFGMNIFHNIQMIAGANYYVPMEDNFITVGSNQPVSIGIKWQSVFNNRSGLSFFGGLRILL